MDATLDRELIHHGPQQRNFDTASRRPLSRWLHFEFLHPQGPLERSRERQKGDATWLPKANAADFKHL